MKNKIYIGLVGELGGGKDTVAKLLKKRFGAKILTSSYLLKESLGVFLDEFSRKDLIWFVEELIKEYGEDVISKAMMKSMESFSEKIVVFNGVRLPSDYEYLKKKKASLIYITAPPRLRWERIRNRQEKTDDKASYRKFIEVQKAKTERDVPKIGEKADFKIENDGTLEELERKVEEVIGEIKRVRGVN